MIYLTLFKKTKKHYQKQKKKNKYDFYQLFFPHYLAEFMLLFYKGIPWVLGVNLVVGADLETDFSLNRQPYQKDIIRPNFR